jgi:hypothetical protein
MNPLAIAVSSTGSATRVRAVGAHRLQDVDVSVEAPMFAMNRGSSGNAFGWARKLQLQLLLALAAAPAHAATKDAPERDSFPQLPPELSSNEPASGSVPELPAELSEEATSAESSSEPGITLGLQIELWDQTLLSRVGPRDSDELAATNVGRLALDFRRDDTLGKGFRLGISNRFDGALDLVKGDGAPSYQGAWNSLRELWLGWQRSTAVGAIGSSVGRINIRSGVASGYNPSDFFKENAVRTSLSLDPVALRLNRLGAVMLELHYTHSLGTITAAAVPRLVSSTQTDGAEIQDEERWYSLGLARTNAKSALFLKWEMQLAQAFSADLLAFVRGVDDVRGGANLSAVLLDTLVANAEWVVGHCHPLPSVGQANAGREACAWGANNLTWTTPLGFDLTVEYQYAGDALSGEAWREWRSADASANLQAVATRRALAREPLVRHGWFARVGWQDPFAIRGLSLSAMAQFNGYDGSCVSQLSVDWRNSKDWLFGGNAIGFLGGNDTEFGMQPGRFALGAYVGHPL